MSAPTPDIESAPGLFADWAEVYRRRGYWPRPITPGSKACHVREWQKPDSELSDATLASWLTSHAHFGIGLLMGSPFPDGTSLGAFDIDRDEYVRIGRAVLRDPPCGQDWQEGCGLLRSRRWPPQQSRVQGSGRRGRSLWQGCRVSIRQKALRHPADDPSRHRQSLPLDREASLRGRIR